MTSRISKRLVATVAAVSCMAAASTDAFPSLAQGAANAPNSAASCTGLGANFASQFGSANGQLQAVLAQALRPIGQQISPTSQQHLGSYEACIGG